MSDEFPEYPKPISLSEYFIIGELTEEDVDRLVYDFEMNDPRAPWNQEEDGE